MSNKQIFSSERAMGSSDSSFITRSEKVIRGYRSQMRGSCRFKETAVSGRVYRKYSREEILRTWGGLGDTVCQGISE